MLENKKGFTLIELMIVMAIIGILAVFALLVISGKSADARDARRISDANRIQLAFRVHAADHGEDYLEGNPADGITMLLHELGNKDELTYLDLDYIKDPIAGRTNTCFSGIGMVLQCDQAGGYTLFDLLQSDANHIGTFDNYAIGIKLENEASIARFEKMDWQDIFTTKVAHAATCGTGICEYWDGENQANCPADCYCGDFYCVIADGETALNCPNDCWCEDTVCDASENEVSCYYDCGTHTCGDGFCYSQPLNDDEPPIQETNGGCPVDCACNLNGVCDGGETLETCSNDCADPGPIGGGGGPEICGDGICGPGEMFLGSCALDCGGGLPVGGDAEDTNDWMVITPRGLYRSAINEVDLSNLIVW
jgi:prepilin-type N-terminal cleavage/methylation domain-containing protein